MSYQHEEVLRWTRARLRSTRRSGLLPDGVVQLFWENVPLGGSETLREWVIDNRSVTTELHADGKPFEGTWRLVSVDIEKAGREDDRHEIIVCIYARQHQDAIPFSAARIIRAKDDKQNSHWLVAQWTNLDRSALPALKASLRGLTVTSPQIDGQTWPGTHYTYMVEAEWAEDGSGVLKWTAGLARWDVETYQRIGLPGGSTNTEIFNVPKELAQSIVDAWKASNPIGASADVSLSEGADVPNSVDIRLSKRIDDEEVSFSLTDYPISCNQDATQHLYWGITQQRVNQLVAQYATRAPGRRTNVSVSFREQDGLYNLSIEISQRLMGPAHTPVLVTEVARSQFTVEERHQEWGLTKTEAEALAVPYATAEAGVAKDVSISYSESDCTYDFVGRKVYRADSYMELLPAFDADGDTIERQYYAWYLKDAAEVMAYLEANGFSEAEEPDPNTRRDVRIFKNEDDSFNVILTLTVDRKREATTFSIDTGSREDGLYLFSATSAEAEEFLDTHRGFDETEAGTIHRRQINLRKNSVGSWDASVVVTTPSTGHASIEWTINNIEYERTWHYSKSKSEADTILGTVTPPARGRMNVNTFRNELGAYTIDILKVTYLDGGVYGPYAIDLPTQTFSQEYHFGLTPAQLQALVNNNDEVATGDLDIRIRPNDDGTFDVSLFRTDDKEDNFTHLVEKDFFRATQLETQWGLENKEDIPEASQTVGVLEAIRYERNRTGRYNYTRTVQTSEAYDSGWFKSLNGREEVNYVRLFFNQIIRPPIPTEVETGLPSTTINAIWIGYWARIYYRELTLNADETWSGQIVFDLDPVVISSEGPSNVHGTANNINYNFVDRQTKDVDGVVYKRDTTYKFNRARRATEEKAADAIGNDAIGQPRVFVERLGRQTYWVAEWITEVTPGTTWEAL